METFKLKLIQYYNREKKKGDLIFCSPITFVASSNCILNQNASPYFIDINKDTFNLDTELLKFQLKNKEI